MLFPDKMYSRDYLASVWIEAILFQQLFMRISEIKFQRIMVGTVRDEINWQTDEYDRLNIINIALIIRQIWLSVVGSHKTYRLTLACHRK